MLLLLLLPHGQERGLHLPRRTLGTKSTPQTTNIRTTPQAEKLGLVGWYTEIHATNRMAHLVLPERIWYLLSGRMSTHLRAHKATQPTT